MTAKKRIRKRTAKGNVPAAARRRYGNKRGAFPIVDRKSALAALRLRGRAKTKRERESILRRAAKYAPEEAKRAREADKRAGKI